MLILRFWALKTHQIIPSIELTLKNLSSGSANIGYKCVALFQKSYAQMIGIIVYYVMNK